MHAACTPLTAPGKINGTTWFSQHLSGATAALSSCANSTASQQANILRSTFHPCWGKCAYGITSRGHVGHHRPVVLSGPESLPSGRASAPFSGQTVLLQQTGSTLFRSCQRCWEVYAHGGEVWGPTGHHPAALGGPVWPTRQHANGGRQAGRCGPIWRWMAASCCVSSLGQVVRVSRRSKRPLDARRM